MVEAMDMAVGKVIAKLEELKLRDSTLIIFTSDNGGLSTSEGWPTSNAPLRGGKGWMYEGGIREPLVVVWPGVTKPGSIIATPVSSPDFFPTLLDAAGVNKPEGLHLDGVSLRQALDGSASGRALFWHYPHYGNQGGAPSAAIRRGDLKLIYWYEDQRIELFDLTKDLSETKNLAQEQTDKVKSMLAELNQWQQQVGAKFPINNPRFTADNPNGRGAVRKK
jgi:arylsulfatase A-like enzyme